MPIAKSAPRPPRRRHPVLEGWPKGVFCPAAVGVVSGYPRTEEIYVLHVERLRANHAKAKAAGRMTRKGVPNGWRGQRDQVVELRQKATDDGWRIVNVLHRNSVGPNERLDAPFTDAEMADIAMAYGLSVLLDPTQTDKTRLNVARWVMPFLTPARGSLKGLDDGLACLRGLVEEAGGAA